MNTISNFNQHKNNIKNEIVKIVSDYFKNNPEDIYPYTFFEWDNHLKELLNKYSRKDLILALNSMESDCWVKLIKHIGSDGLFDFKCTKYMLDENPTAFVLNPAHLYIFTNRLATMRMNGGAYQMISRSDLATSLSIPLNESLYISEMLENRGAISFYGDVSGQHKERIRTEDKIFELIIDLDEEYKETTIDPSLPFFEDILTVILQSRGLSTEKISEISFQVKNLKQETSIEELLSTIAIPSSITQSTGALITEALVFSQKGLSAKHVSSLMIIK